MSLADAHRSAPTSANRQPGSARSVVPPGAALLTAEDVAEMTGMGVDWIYAQSRRGRIPTVKLGRYRRYRLEAIEQWLRDNEI